MTLKQRKSLQGNFLAERRYFVIKMHVLKIISIKILFTNFFGEIP